MNKKLATISSDFSSYGSPPRPSGLSRSPLMKVPVRWGEICLEVSRGLDEDF